VSVQLRWDQCCESTGCKRPARFGVLCTACFLESPPARRAVESAAPTAGGREPRADDVVDPEGAAWLRELWAA
jgi:hypothetical protein